MDLNEIFIFYRVAEAGSFTAAGKQLGLPKSTVSRKIQNLENELGVMLVRRTTRKLHLTEAGQRLFDGSRGPLAELSAAARATKAGQREPQGRIKMTAPADVGHAVLAKVLPELAHSNPKIILDIVLTDRMVDLDGEGFDLALRFGPLKDSHFVARRIGATSTKIYGSPTFVKAAGGIKTIEEAQANIRYRFTSVPADDYFTLRGPASSAALRLKPTESIQIDSFMAIKEFVLSGEGLAILPTFLCREDIQKRRLQTVMDGWSGRASPVQLLYSKQRFVVPAAATVRDFLLARLPNFFDD